MPRTIDWIQIHPTLSRVAAHIQKVDDEGDVSTTDCNLDPKTLSTYAAFVAEVEAACSEKTGRTVTLAVPTPPEVEEVATDE